MQNINFLIDEILNDFDSIENNKVKEYFAVKEVTDDLLSRHEWLKEITGNKPNCELVLPITFDAIENEIINFQSGLKLRYTYVYSQTEAIKELVKEDKELLAFIEQYLPVSRIRYIAI